MEEQVSDGRLGALALHGASCLTGGIPLKVDGEVVGAVGTSGETPDEDESCSIAGAGTDFSTTEFEDLTQEGARLAADAAAEAAAERGVAPVVSAVDAGGALVYLHAPRRRPGRERRGDDRQGPHSRDLPASEQGLRGSGLQWPRPRRCTSLAPCRCRAASRSSIAARS